MANFADSVQIVLKHEGGYAFNPADPGGETKFGISKKQYPSLNIAGLTPAEAMQIYHKDYWAPHKLDQIINQRIADAVLDAVVHHGKGPSIVQKAANAAGASLKVDNIIGPNTIAALNTVSEQDFLAAYVKERKTYMDNLISRNPALSQFRAGWFKRVDFFLGNRKTKYNFLALIAVIAVVGLFINKKKLRLL